MATSIFDVEPGSTAGNLEVEDFHLVISARRLVNAYEELLTRFQQPVYALGCSSVPDDQGEACDVRCGSPF